MENIDIVPSSKKPRASPMTPEEFNLLHDIIKSKPESSQSNIIHNKGGSSLGKTKMYAEVAAEFAAATGREFTGAQVKNAVNNMKKREKKIVAEKYNTPEQYTRNYINTAYRPTGGGEGPGAPAEHNPDESGDDPVYHLPAFTPWNRATLTSDWLQEESSDKVGQKSSPLEPPKGIQILPSKSNTKFASPIIQNKSSTTKTNIPITKSSTIKTNIPITKSSTIKTHIPSTQTSTIKTHIPRFHLPPKPPKASNAANPELSHPAESIEEYNPFGIEEVTSPDELVNEEALQELTNNLLRPVSSTSSLSPERTTLSPQKSKFSSASLQSVKGKENKRSAKNDDSKKPKTQKVDAGADYFEFMKKRQLGVTKEQIKTEKLKQSVLKKKDLLVTIELNKKENIDIAKSIISKEGGNPTEYLQLAEIEDDSDQSNSDEFEY